MAELAEPREQVVDLGHRRSPFPRPETPQRGESQVLRHCQPFDDTTALGDVGHTAAGDHLDRAAEQFLAFESNRTPRGA